MNNESRSAPQHYSPYRTSLLTKENLTELSKLRPQIMVRDTLVNWTIIILAWSIVAGNNALPIVLLAMIVVGTRFYALIIIGHDGLHRRLFSSIQSNDLWADVFVHGPIGAITRINRTNHMEHHRVTCLADDPDRHKYVHNAKDTRFGYLSFLTGLASFQRAATNIFTPTAKQKSSYTFRDIVILIGWQAALIGGLTYFIGWWAYPVLWLIPVYIFAYCADLVRVFSEHSMLIDDSDADAKMRLISYESNWLEKQFFAPHNMNHHISHHLWPSIPYYHLPEADKQVRASSACDDNIVWRKSYIAYLLEYWRWVTNRSLTAARTST